MKIEISKEEYKIIKKRRREEENIKKINVYVKNILKQKGIDWRSYYIYNNGVVVRDKKNHTQCFRINKK